MNVDKFVFVMYYILRNKKAPHKRRKETITMSEKQQKILNTLAEVLPGMDQYEKGYMMGTINTAAAMSKKKEAKAKKSAKASGKSEEGR